MTTKWTGFIRAGGMALSAGGLALSARGLRQSAAGLGQSIPLSDTGIKKKSSLRKSQN